MIHPHNEIESKLAADDVDVDDFRLWCMENLDVERYLHIEDRPDDYYRSGTAVVRHRQDPGNKHELTVKRRKSTTSTNDRQEIDLHFAASTSPVDVAAFLGAAGFKYEFTVIKDAHIFWVKLTELLQASFVIYDVYRADEPDRVRRFIEIEAEKGSMVSPVTAKRHVRNWVESVRARFQVIGPLNQSLWEIFSGEDSAVA